jgi:hypothetical protein
MELFVGLFILAAIAVANALYSVAAIALARRMPRVFHCMGIISVLVIFSFAFTECLLLLQSVELIGAAPRWMAVPPMVIAVFLTPPAISNLVVGRLRIRYDPPTYLIWLFSVAAGSSIGMFLYIQLLLG